MLREITLHHYERLHFIVMKDYTSLLLRLSIWIIQPAVHFYRRSEFTEDSFQSTHTHYFLRPFSLSATSSPLRLSILTAPMRPYLPIIGWPEMNHITITDSYYALVCYRRGNILFLPAKTVTFQPLPSDFTVGSVFTADSILYARSTRLRSLRSLRHSILSSPFLHFERLHFIVIEITLHCYERLHFIVIEITLHCYERLHFIVIEITLHCYSDSKSMLREIPLVFELYNPPSIFTVGMIWRRILSTFLFSTFHFVHKHPRPFSLSATSSPLSPVHSYGAYATFPFYTLDSIITRDYTSLLLGFQLIITRDYSSLLREIKYLNYTTRRLFLP
jgi:hypothetical protein